MASFSAPEPLLDQYHSLQSKLSPHLRQAYHYRPRTRRARAIFAAVAFCFFLLLLAPRSHKGIPNYYTIFPSYHPFPQRPEDSLVAGPEKPAVTINDTLPSNLQKSNPLFHVIVPALHRTPELCRTVTSAMILNYPPPTLIGYNKQLEDGSTQYDAMVDKVESIYKFLEHARDVNDEDFVLVLDGRDYFFQLPPEVMIRRFQSMLRENNMKLLKKYGVSTVENPHQQGVSETVQKYTQRVFFGASKQCCPHLEKDPGCVTVPQSSLPPDAYGYKTDIHPGGHLNRPRWINPGTVMGQVADLKLIYAQVLESVQQRRNKTGDYIALTQMYGRQEYIREMERRRTSSSLKEWLYKQIGISDASNTTGVRLRLEAGRRYEYGIGLDYKSNLFFNMFNSREDVEWLPYNNISKTSSAQAKHGVPRERRLLLPADLSKNIENPFVESEYDSEDTITPPFNQTIDALPNPQKRSWHNLPLLTNIHSAAVPALVHLDGDPGLRDAWWEKMWYHPWARALLRKHVRSPNGFSAAQDALLGGQEWWDMRGGRGGVWTDRGEWIDYRELCNGFERDVFHDEFGPWGAEVGASNAEPVYNQFGRLIKGKEG